MLALLMIGDRLVKVAEMQYRAPYLRYGISLQANPYYPTLMNTSDVPDTTNSTTSAIIYDIPISVFRQELVFRLSRQVDWDTYEYQYEYEPKNQHFKFEMHESIQWGIQLPDAKINLHKLRRKLRRKKKMKELLLKYYRS